MVSFAGNSQNLGRSSASKRSFSDGRRVSGRDDGRDRGYRRTSTSGGGVAGGFLRRSGGGGGGGGFGGAPRRSSSLDSDVRNIGVRYSGGGGLSPRAEMGKSVSFAFVGLKFLKCRESYVATLCFKRR